MRKAAVAPCAFIVLTLTMLAASGADKTVTNKELGFEITFPESWTMLKMLSKSLAVVGTSGPPDGSKGGTSLSVNVYDVNEGTSLKAFVETKTLGMEKLYKDFQFVEKVELKIGDANACKITFVYRDQEPVKCVFHYLAAGKHGYIIKRPMDKAENDPFAKDIDAIVKSFKLIEAK